MSENGNIEENEVEELIVSPCSQKNLDHIVRAHVIWAMGAGLIPVPVFDIAAVTAIQMDALKKLAAETGVDYTSDKGKQFVAALTGGTFARLGASLIKSIPGVGTVVGGLSMSALSAASTYAVCQVAISNFHTEKNFVLVDLDEAKRLYEKALEKGKTFVKSLENDEKTADTKEIYQNLEKLKSLHESGVLTEEEFEVKKSQLLEKL